MRVKLFTLLLSISVFPFSSYAQQFFEVAPNGEVTASGYNYSNPKKTSYSIDESAFVGTQNGTILRGRTNGTGGAFFYGDPNPIQSGMFAPVNLPHESRVAKIKVFFNDTSLDYNLRMRLSAHDLTTGAYIDYATLISSGDSGFGVLEFSPNVMYIDNNSKSYQFMVDAVDESGHVANWQAYFTVIRGAVIEYELMKVN